ncbi:pleckstrin homology domain-containing family G member 4B isoform X2 [Electrophorus electricus]|uniref:pleckstrin homology domain-containing family G member 4B isoform X2 n=1 Tax=Electrophorus electricus TaxID=8005 RepID=UPI0015D02C32|nr:pleckstrin homology domain-containing family G member 4B isoform X2 [Electrophorus electricus]
MLLEAGKGAMHSREKSRSCENYLSIKDTESLDSCIQSTLSVLYAPFGATAATVLWQLFSVVERQYRGDGLRCFLDFLLPAKRILHTIQRETCLRYQGLLLYHDGWPLCIHEKVVLQLAPLHKVRLRQGDFYLQVVPLGRKAAKLVLKCLSGSGHAVAEIPVPESMYGSVFTADFLQNVTRERKLQPLQNCLLSTGAAVYRTPWRNVVNPVLASRAGSGTMQPRQLGVCGGSLRGQLATCSDRGSTGTLDSRRSSRESLGSLGGESTASAPPLGRSPALAPMSDPEKGPARGSGGSRCLSFSTDLSNPTPRRRHPRDSATFETRRLFRKSYMEALQNPMNLGSSSESILETGGRKAGGGEAGGKPRARSGSEVRPTQRESLQQRFCSRGRLGGDDSRVGPTLLPLHRSLQNAERQNQTERRSKSLERTGKASQVKGHRARSASGSSGGGSPRKLMNGYTLRFGKLDLEAAFSATESRGSKGDSELPDSPAVSESRRGSSGGEDSPRPSLHFSISAPLSVVPSTGCGLSLPSLLSQVNLGLLDSGAVTLLGNQDRAGHSLLQVCMRNRVWTDESFTSREFVCLLGYYCSTLRKEKMDLGLTVLVDTRRQQASPALFSALAQLKAHLPNALSSVLLLVDKDTSIKLERNFPIPCEVLSSLKALQKYVDSSQLTSDLDGTFSYSHGHFVQFRQKMEQFSSSCTSAISSLRRSIDVLNSSSSLDTAKEVEEMISQQKKLMRSVLEDSHLNCLRLEGGTFLARARKEEACEIESYRDAVDMACALYNQMDEEVHKLVILSNKSLQQLENLLELRTVQEESERIKCWFSMEGEKNLAPLDSLSFTLGSLQEMRQSLGQFTEEAALQQKQAVALLQDSRHASSSALLDLTEYTNSVLQHADTRRHELQILVTLYEFYDSADQWVAHCQDYFQHVCLTESGAKLSPEVLQILREYHSEATKFSLENFSSLNETVATLGSPRELQQWNLVWMKCQSTRRQLEEALVGEPEAEPDSDTTPPCPRGPPEPAGKPGSTTPPPADGTSKPLQLQGGEGSSSSCLPGTPPQVPRLTLALDLEDGKPRSAGPFSEGDSPFLSSHFPFLPEGDELSPSLFDDTDSDCTVDSSYSCRSEPTCSPAARHRRPPLKKIMKKTVSYELAPRDRGHSDTSHNSYTGVYIKGLEVTNNVCVEKKLQRSDVKSPPLIRSTCLSSSSPSSSPRVHCRITEVETKRQSSKIQHIMDEMISTEREYVRSLAYVIEHYYPEMERPDLPQDLRAKRSIIFGNLEKLCDFHGQYFLKDLEQCAHSPLSISGCFLRHEEQFGMYALYSKNKPRSDVLLSSHGNSFFKNKQVQLEDKMDLASYLLKPVQRMSKYALLLKDLIKECSQSQEQELTDLRTAEEMVKFQLRHGNDLLAMDAIRGCDVNLKEQGQLRCQDEFIVWCGRRKYPRRVFLFEDLILFSKTKKIEGGYDIYIYKQSFKTAEIGMTENVGDSGLRFEIWFRRRKSQDTFILQASSAENKAAWTTIIGKILWRQALRNRELRMQEMVSMGIGNKPYMDIKPSDAAISNRSINYIMKGTEPRSRSSVTVPTFDYSSPFKRPHSTISNSSTSSSGSQSSSSFLGSLNPHLHAVSTHPLPGCPALAHWAYDCIEEDELEQDTGIQPSMITESSETSSQSTSSDGATSVRTLTVPCHSALVVDAYPSEPSSFLCSSPPSSSSPILFHKEQELPAETSKFITAL